MDNLTTDNAPFDQWRNDMLNDLRIYFKEHNADPDHALAQLPTDLLRLIRHGHFSCIRDLVDKAVRSLKEALRIDPNSYDANCALGRIHMGQGYYSTAEMYFKDAIKLKDDNFKDILSLLYVIKKQDKNDDFSDAIQNHIRKIMRHSLDAYSIPGGGNNIFDILDNQEENWTKAFSPELQRQYLANKAVVIKNVLPSIYFDLINAQQKAARENKLLIHDEARSRFVSFDLLSAAVLANFQLCSLVKMIIGKEVIPTYAFSIHYVEGGVITPHRDRAQNELSMSLSLDVSPEGMKWPLYAGDKPKARAMHLGLNDALLYRGMEVTHFRKKLQQGRSCDQIIFGFRTVDKAHCNCV